MAKDAVIIVQNPGESLKATNGRLRAACQETDVTGAHLVVIHGRPIITLTAETEEMSEEDVEALTEEAKTDKDAEAELKALSEVDFQVAANDSLIVVVKRLLLTEQASKGEFKGMSGAEACAFTEDGLNKLLEKADGSVDSLQFAECSSTRDAYVLVSFRRDDEVHAAEPADKQS